MVPEEESMSFHMTKEEAGSRVAELGLGSINNRAAEATHVAQ